MSCAMTVDATLKSNLNIQIHIYTMDLFSHLNWYRGTRDDGAPLKCIPPGKLIAVTDTLEAEGSFIIHDVLQSISKRDDMATCLLGLHQSLFHYHSVGRKLGYNLTNEHQKGRFSFINALHNSYSWIDRLQAEALEEAGIDEAGPLDNISKGFQPFPTSTISKHQGSVSQFLNDVFNAFVNDHQARVAKMASTGSGGNMQTLFIIDNLNLLSSFGGCRDLDLLHFLQTLHTYVGEQGDCSVLLLFHSDCNVDDTFFKLLQYEADLTINIGGLKSGYSKDIDGQIEFLQKMDDNTLHRLSPILYQVLDNNIRYFAMGSRI
ncbi:hypothetical protein SAMD00019534_116960 [Acytostelium subglobosum LB1]|uniref:hypothetical protein n=1 Tax=Acytostelium subglobosum LB1 TaxID=1410327 RepID=UPI000644DA7D|nr:hypothetical protein SAMD00019534_116960 [Acytostelium subglobosum LB1]GAM28520.1 hypothetical protein SAMD00019534_116960 [Acytostelium subglobosum LB1]|eukprot:XP_012748559.1 hypothetical protein SAMD00019534_116960 [Acytostelium subglobosum LB1]